MTTTYKGVEIGLNEAMEFTALINGKPRTFTMLVGAKSAIENSQKTTRQKITSFAKTFLFLALVPALLIGMGWLIDAHETRGVLADASCRISTHRAVVASTPTRKVKDMGVGELAHVTYVIVDKERRIYLRDDTPLVSGISEFPSEFAVEVARRSDGWYIKCGDFTLPDPETSTLAGVSWAIPVKGLY